LHPTSSRWELPIKTFLRLSLAVAVFAGLSCVPASASDTSYTMAVGAVQLTGAIDINDSDGNGQAVNGTASGAVSGKYSLDYGNPHAEIAGAGVKLILNYSSGSQNFTARLDTCATPDSCTPGSLVTVWEK
jgi:hypothetical protein